MGSDTPNLVGGRAIAIAADIERLRAVGPCLARHEAFWWKLPGGFAGVGIFYVISDYLITGVFDREMRESRFSLATATAAAPTNSNGSSERI